MGDDTYQNQNKKVIVVHGSVFFIIQEGLNSNNRRKNRWLKKKSK